MSEPKTSSEQVATFDALGLVWKARLEMSPTEFDLENFQAFAQQVLPTTDACVRQKILFLAATCVMALEQLAQEKPKTKQTQL